MSQSGILRVTSGILPPGVIEVINGDTGFITGPNVTIYAHNSTNNSGATVKFVNSGTVSTFDVTDTLTNNTYVGNLCGNVASNIAQTCTTNTGFGQGALQNVTTSSFNVAIGAGALNSLTTASSTGANIAIGWGALNTLLTGQDNVVIGQSVGNQYTGAETGNILIGSVNGTTGENFVTRIGPTTGLEAIQKCFLGGISGVTVAASAPTAVASTGQLSSLGFGTSGQVLTSNGAGNSPTWQAAGGGGSTTYFQAYLTSPQTVAGGNTTTTIVFNSAVDNVGGAYNTGTGVFTAPATGYYAFSTTVFFNNITSAAGNTQIILGYTGSVQSLRLVNTGVGGYSGGNQQICSVAWFMPMTSGDTIKIQPFADGAGNYQIFGAALSSGAFNTASTFSGFRVA